ncbi:hypothetical protein BN2497_4187 [Janthinobacterium sp. CG23_2]|nr:hypothetical protein BN2497_4187 [Janthinobacterium sp. CG23_2]CUU28491.1 hypothetical protein BN3177_4187 [Janthinobacterium sp. CG23_2]
MDPFKSCLFSQLSLRYASAQTQFLQIIFHTDPSKKRPASCSPNYKA